MRIVECSGESVVEDYLFRGYEENLMVGMFGDCYGRSWLRKVRDRERKYILLGIRQGVLRR